MPRSWAQVAAAHSIPAAAAVDFSSASAVVASQESEESQKALESVDVNLTKLSLSTEEIVQEAIVEQKQVEQKQDEEPKVRDACASTQTALCQDAGSNTVGVQQDSQSIQTQSVHVHHQETQTMSFIISDDEEEEEEDEVADAGEVADASWQTESYPSMCVNHEQDHVKPTSHAVPSYLNSRLCNRSFDTIEAFQKMNSGRSGSHQRRSQSSQPHILHRSSHRSFPDQHYRTPLDGGEEMIMGSQSGFYSSPYYTAEYPHRKDIGRMYAGYGSRPMMMPGYPPPPPYHMTPVNAPYDMKNQQPLHGHHKEQYYPSRRKSSPERWAWVSTAKATDSLVLTNVPGYITRASSVRQIREFLCSKLDKKPLDEDVNIPRKLAKYIKFVCCPTPDGHQFPLLENKMVVLILLHEDAPFEWILERLVKHDFSPKSSLEVGVTDLDLRHWIRPLDYCTEDDRTFEFDQSLDLSSSIEFADHSLDQSLELVDDKLQDPSKDTIPIPISPILASKERAPSQTRSGLSTPTTHLPKKPNAKSPMSPSFLDMKQQPYPFVHSYCSPPNTRFLVLHISNSACALTGGEGEFGLVSLPLSSAFRRLLRQVWIESVGELIFLVRDNDSFLGCAKLIYLSPDDVLADSASSESDYMDDSRRTETNWRGHVFWCHKSPLTSPMISAYCQMYKLPVELYFPAPSPYEVDPLLSKLDVALSRFLLWLWEVQPVHDNSTLLSAATEPIPYIPINHMNLPPNRTTSFSRGRRSGPRQLHQNS